MSAAKRKRPTRASRAAAAVVLGRKVVEPGLMAAVNRAAKVKGLSQRDIDRLPDAQLKRPDNRAGNDFHIAGDEIRPGLGTLPESLTATEVRDLRYFISERGITVPVREVGRITNVAADTPDSLIRSAIEDVQSLAGEVNGIHMLLDHIADSQFGPLPESGAVGNRSEPGMGALGELRFELTQLRARISALGDQARRFNAL